MVFGDGEGSVPFYIMDNNVQFTFLDIITLLGFVISLENLNQNLSQNDKQDLQNDLSEKAERILNEIHTHLQDQDEKLNRIMEIINEKD